MFFRKNKPQGPIDYIVVGLGNPGKKYEGTRHNAGFAAIEALADKLGVSLKKVKFKACCGEAQVGEHRVLLMMPQTFMNLSGEAVTEAMRFYKVAPENVIVILDDITQPVGSIRIRRKGGDGGQRGMRSIISLSGSETFPRIKIGVGQKPHPDYDLAAWVLSQFTQDEAKKMVEAVEHTVEAVLLMIKGEINEAMNAYSR